MKRNHQNRDVVQQLSTHFRYALLVLVLAAPSAYAAPSPAPDRFAQADSNHDGKLSRDEASDYLVIEIFTSRDANHDGVVTVQEALAYGKKKGMAVIMIKKADTNKDGFLSRQEVAAYYASKEGPPR